MALLGSLMEPAAAAALLVLPSLVTNLWQLFAGPAIASLTRRLWPMLLTIAIAALASSSLPVTIEPRWSGLALGLALMLCASYALLAPQLQAPARFEPWLTPLTGLTTDLITGATGVFVIPAVPYCRR